MNYKEILKSKVVNTCVIGLSTTIIGFTGANQAHAAEQAPANDSSNADSNKVVIQYQDENGETNTKEIKSNEALKASSVEKTVNANDDKVKVENDEGQSVVYNESAEPAQKEDTPKEQVNDEQQANTNNDKVEAENDKDQSVDYNEPAQNEDTSKDSTDEAQSKETENESKSNVETKDNTQKDENDQRYVEKVDLDKETPSKDNYKQPSLEYPYPDFENGKTGTHDHYKIPTTSDKAEDNKDSTSKEKETEQSAKTKEDVPTKTSLGSIKKERPTAKITGSSHTVEKGETVYNISKRSGVSMDNIRKWNNLKNDTLRVGQTLKLTDPTPKRNTTPITSSTHAVEKGETVYNIATRSGVSIQNLRKWNNLKNDTLRVGQILKVKAPVVKDMSPIKSEIYSIKAGDTLYSIAKRSGVTVNDLKKWNKLSSNNVVKGQVIRVKPIKSNTTPITGNVHTVVAHDTLYSISKRTGISMDNLRKWNKLSNDNLRVGQQLRLTAPTTSSTKPTYPKPAGRDTYGSMKQLEDVYKDKEGQVWSREWRFTNNDSIVFAPHGGGIEVGTTEIARLIAERGGHDYFSFNGLKSSNNRELHVTSTHYDDPVISKEIKKKDIAVSIHGAAGTKPIAYVGGLDRKLVNQTITELRNRGFNAQYAPSNLAGTDPENIVNKTTTGQGLQLELTTAFRKSMFKNNDWSKSNRVNEANWTNNMYKFADAINAAVAKAH